jgi:hypothetical protein
MDDMLKINREFADFRRETERRIAHLESEVSHLDWKRMVDATERSITFWFGVVFFTGLLLVVAFAKDWA